MAFTLDKLTNRPPLSYFSNANSGAKNYVQLSRQGSLQADEIGKKIQNFSQLINDLYNPSISKSLLFQSFKQLVGPALFTQVCHELAQKLGRNPNEGAKILEEEFHTIQSLRDQKGRTPLDQILDSFREQLEIQRAQNEIANFAATLTSLQQARTKNPQSPTTMGELQGKAEREFKELSERAKQLLLGKFLEVAGQPAIQDLLELINLPNISTIDLCLQVLETEKSQPPVLRIDTRLEPSIQSGIQSGDTAITIQEILKVYDLQVLKRILGDKSLSNQDLSARIENLHPNLKKLLYTLVWIAHFKPDEDGFGRRILRENPRLLTGMISGKGSDLLSQLISHQENKILSLRLKKEIEAFMIEAGDLAKTPYRLSQKFEALSTKAKEGLRHRVWFVDGGHSNPLFGGWGYGENTIRNNPLCIFNPLPNKRPLIQQYSIDLENQYKAADAILLDAFSAAKTLPSTLVDADTKRLEEEPELINYLPENLRVAFVTAELAGIANIGGLASALDGMVRGFGADNSRVIMPLYRNGPIADARIQEMKKTKYEVEGEGKKVSIYKMNLNGVRCYFVDDPMLFTIEKKADKTAGNFYDGNFHEMKHRWAFFQKAAAELSYQFSKKNHPVELVHVHDAQTALVPKFLATQHPQEYRDGETPATVFTFHNNQEPNRYEDAESVQILRKAGLDARPMNSFIEGLNDAEMVTTVSRTYAKEAQMTNPDFGNGMNTFVHRIAAEGKLVGIVNGNSNGWNPARDAQLQQWTLDYTWLRTNPKPRDASGAIIPPKSPFIDLRFGPDMDPLELANRTKEIQRHLCRYLSSLDRSDPAYADLDPEKPIVMYIGRYDTNQKGINKLPLIMEETLRNGGQFVCIGLEPDSQAKEILEQMKKRAKELGNKGVLIVEDRRVQGGFQFQGVFGSLLRAATSLAIFPSKYEPCGLVQGESNRFGATVVATKTGGFPDTLTTEGEGKNGYLFPRCNVWNSEEQDDAIRSTLHQALEETKIKHTRLYHGTQDEQIALMRQKQTIMRNAINSTWEQTPDHSLSAIRRMELVYAKAFQRRTMRGVIPTDLKTLQI